MNTTDDTQREIAGRVHEWEAYSDSHNGEWGPGAMALALKAYGAPGYEVRAFETLTRRAARRRRAIKKTHSPAILLAWRGAHTWVMTGYRASGDPATFRNTKIDGAYILDPWYPGCLVDLGTVEPAGDLHELRGAAGQLPALAAARGPIQGPRRPVHHGRPHQAAAELGASGTTRSRLPALGASGGRSTGPDARGTPRAGRP